MSFRNNADRPIGKPLPAPTTPGTMSWPPQVWYRAFDQQPAEVFEPFPHDIATVQEGLEKLSQAECMVRMDELMSRRPHNKTLLSYMVQLWRQDRTSWGDARDRRADKKEAEE